MRLFFCTSLAIWAMALAAPVGAQAQAVTSFDGTYVGVLLTTSNSVASCSVKSPVPAALMISGGTATTKQGEASFQGIVNAPGTLQLHRPGGTLMSGKVDTGGTATAGVTVGARGCTYSFAWKKR